MHLKERVPSIHHQLKPNVKVTSPLPRQFLGLLAPVSSFHTHTARLAPPLFRFIEFDIKAVGDWTVRLVAAATGDTPAEVMAATRTHSTGMAGHGVEDIDDVWGVDGGTNSPLVVQTQQVGILVITFSLCCHLTCPPQGKTMRIRGPFGAPAEHSYQYDNIVLIASGIGATPFAAVMKVHNPLSLAPHCV